MKKKIIYLLVTFLTISFSIILWKMMSSDKRLMENTAISLRSALEKDNYEIFVSNLDSESIYKCDSAGFKETVKYFVFDSFLREIAFPDIEKLEYIGIKTDKEWGAYFYKLPFDDSYMINSLLYRKSNSEWKYCAVIESEQLRTASTDSKKVLMEDPNLKVETLVDIFQGLKKKYKK